MNHVDSLRKVAVGYPVLGILNDTIFTLYVRVGSYSPANRAAEITERVRIMYNEDFSEKDSLYISKSQDYVDIMYADRIVMTVTEHDALWNNTTTEQLATDYKDAISASLLKARDEYSTRRLLIRAGLVLASIACLVLMIYLINRLMRLLRRLINRNKKRWFKDLKYKDYTVVSTEQEAKLTKQLINILRWVLIIILFLVLIPVIFSIFPFSRGWADEIFHVVMAPFRNIGQAIWNYIPNLINIIVIYLVMHYLGKVIKYFFNEIKNEKLKLPGFHHEFAEPTYAIVRILLTAFTLILIFPYLPGSGSEAFNGISIFVGLLVSLGSSSAIANIIAGIVITYMRPFRVGDRVKIDGITGDVLEKTLLVTRLKTVTNEEVTLPNSKVLNASTVNYSTLAETKGLILSTEVTIGYEIPWQRAEELLIKAIKRCPLILEAPRPFVLQM